MLAGVAAMPERGSSSLGGGTRTIAENEGALPSSAPPPPAAPKPRVWFVVGSGRGVEGGAPGSTMKLISAQKRRDRHCWRRRAGAALTAVRTALAGEKSR